MPAVRVMEQLGPAAGHRATRGGSGSSRRCRRTSPSRSAPAEATLIEMTSAYSVFPNQGVRMRPYPILKVTDREGNVLEENRPEPKDAIRADTAFVMTNLLRGVVQRGTAAKAAALNWPIGGKTGTTDDYTDAWFIGFDPDITIGVWVGLDQKKPIGHNQTGAEAALPIWIDIMKAVDRRPQGAAHVRRARQHRLRVGRQGHRQPHRTGHAGRDFRSLHRRHPAGIDSGSRSVQSCRWRSAELSPTRRHAQSIRCDDRRGALEGSRRAEGTAAAPGGLEQDSASWLARAADSRKLTLDAVARRDRRASTRQTAHQG